MTKEQLIIFLRDNENDKFLILDSFLKLKTMPTAMMPRPYFKQITIIPKNYSDEELSKMIPDDNVVGYSFYDYRKTKKDAFRIHLMRYRIPEQDKEASV